MIIDRWKKLQSYIATRVRLGGILPNDGYITGVPKVIFRDQSTTKLTNGGNVGGGLDTLFVYTLPAGSLKSDGDILDFWFAGKYAANDNDKRIAAGWGPATIEDTGLRDIDDLGWILAGRISRVSSTSCIVHHGMQGGVWGADSAQVLVAFNNGAIAFTKSSVVTGMSDLGSNNHSLVVTAEGTADDDIVIRQAIVTLTRF